MQRDGFCRPQSSKTSGKKQAPHGDTSDKHVNPPLYLYRFKRFERYKYHIMGGRLKSCDGLGPDVVPLTTKTSNTFWSRLRPFLASLLGSLPCLLLNYLLLCSKHKSLQQAEMTFFTTTCNESLIVCRDPPPVPIQKRLVTYISVSLLDKECRRLEEPRTSVCRIVALSIGEYLV